MRRSTLGYSVDGWHFLNAPRIGMRAQLLKSLPCKCEDQDSDPTEPMGTLLWWDACNSIFRRLRLEPHSRWASKTSHMLVLGLTERPHFIELRGREMEDESRHQLWKFHMQKHICACTTTHTYKNKHMHIHT